MAANRPPANPFARPFSPEMGKPVMIFCALGAAAGLAGTQGLDIAIGNPPGAGLYMIPAGIWFAFVVALAVRKLGRASPIATAFVIVTTFIAWEASVNLALVLIDPWLKGGPSDVVYGLVGMAAGAVGALITWAGAASAAVNLRRASSALLTVMAGTLLGALLAATNSFDSPALLFVPWEAVVAASLAFALVHPPTP